jgi:hypothetical protein
MREMCLAKREFRIWGRLKGRNPREPAQNRKISHKNRKFPQKIKVKRKTFAYIIDGKKKATPTGRQKGRNTWI